MSHNVLPALRPLVLRGIGLAIVVRLAVVVAQAFASMAGSRGDDPGTFTPAATVVYAGICGALMIVDLARRRELTLFANLGISRAVVATCAVLPALAIQLVLAVLTPR